MTSTDRDREFLGDYFNLLRSAVDLTDDMSKDLIAVRDTWLRSAHRGGKVIFVGNGGSAGIASHLAIDLSKNGGLTATCFNDAAIITCLANDYGYDRVFADALRIYGRREDTLVAISSSGKSANVLNACDMARTLGMSIVTCSGMSADNPLRKRGDINLWLDSKAYNIIETVHQFWMMSVIDLTIGHAEYPADRVTERVQAH